MAKGKHSTALFEVINRPTRLGSAPPQVVSRAPTNLASSTPSTAAGSPAIPPRTPTESVAIDRDHHRVSFTASYTTVGVTTFAVIVVVTLAYLVGRGGGGGNATGPQIANASTEELRRGPAQPAVLNVGSAQNRTTTSVPPATAKPAPTPAGAAPQTASATLGAAIPAPTGVKRVAGKNYCIMQSYPEEATAKEAQAVLLANGISCTVEPGVTGFVPPKWFSVIGTQGFDRVKTSEYEAYAKAVTSVKYGENSKAKFRKFEPQAVRWK
jgi:hypothetical protein